MKNKDSAKDLEFEIKFYEDLLKDRPTFHEALIALGDAYTKNRQYEEGLKIDQKLSKLKPEDPAVFYNLACSYSLLKELKASLEALRKAIKLGYDDFSYMRKDPDLENLRQDKRYKTLFSETSQSKK